MFSAGERVADDGRNESAVVTAASLLQSDVPTIVDGGGGGEPYALLASVDGADDRAERQADRLVCISSEP